MPTSQPEMPYQHVRPTTIVTNAAKFHPGQIVATPGALELLSKHGYSAAAFVARHLAGDWGDCCADDAALNEQALGDGSRLFSVYHLVDAALLKDIPRHKRHNLPTVWIITDAAWSHVGEAFDPKHRRVTTILLPEDY